LICEQNEPTLSHSTHLKSLLPGKSIIEYLQSKHRRFFARDLKNKGLNFLSRNISLVADIHKVDAGVKREIVIFKEPETLCGLVP
jgi:hypothetical protein